MNILLIGNGFDIAHGLPTTYLDFLEFALLSNNLALDLGIGREKRIVRTQEILDYFNSNTVAQKKVNKELHTCLKSNSWIEFFVKKTQSRTKGLYEMIFSNEGDRNRLPTWIDFENGIREVLLNLVFLNENYGFESIKIKSGFKVVACPAVKNIIKGLPIAYDEMSRKTTVSEFIEDYKLYLFKDMEKMTRALEIYLLDYVMEKVAKKNISPDIRSLKFDKIINFNYTDTLNALFDYECCCDYVHGRASLDHTMENCNLVLGTSDIFQDENNIFFIEFEKRYQKLTKGTGKKTGRWIADFIKDNAEKEQSSLYIFGHSLDKTDGSILTKLISREFCNMKTTIFFHNEIAYKKLVANLISLIGDEELLQRLDKDIILKKQ